jgi:hypothetical protein
MPASTSLRETKSCHKTGPPLSILKDNHEKCIIT